MIPPFDLHDIIMSFISNFKDLMSWRHTCKSTFHDYTASFYCSKMYRFIKTPLINITDDTNLNLLNTRTYAESIIISKYMIQDEDLINLKNITYLKFYNTYGYCLTSKIFNHLPKLKTLICNNVTFLNDQALSQLTNLTYLNCQNNPYLNISVSIKNLTKLITLIVDNVYEQDKINYIPLINLTYLVAKNTGIHPSISKILPKLSIINCDNYQYDDKHIMNLYNLSTLICGKKCRFTDNAFKNLTKLNVLKIYNSFVDISDILISTLVNLTDLNCGNTQISDNAFKTLNKMKILQCEDNLIITDISLQYMPNLIEFRCGRNTNFTDNGVSKLINLTLLDCGSNLNITNVTLCSLPKLTALACGFNRNFKEEILHISSQLEKLSWIYINNEENDTFTKFLKSIKCKIIEISN